MGKRNLKKNNTGRRTRRITGVKVSSPGDAIEEAALLALEEQDIVLDVNPTSTVVTLACVGYKMGSQMTASAQPEVKQPSPTTAQDDEQYFGSYFDDIEGSSFSGSMKI